MTSLPFGLRAGWLALLTASLLALLASSQGVGAQGNSEAAHACQKGGYAGLIGADGETFANAGECVSFAARGGGFSTGIVLPAGSTLTLENAVFSACNALTYGYQVNDEALVEVDSRPQGCATAPAGGIAIGPFPTAVEVRLYLTDDTCSTALADDLTYFSDGDHGLVTSVDGEPVQVDLADAGPGCSIAYAPWATPVPPGNLSVDLVIS